jgi:hypothetical protein|tara:strand:- start:2235 stop:3149 length:915 start_codon:yes stop_codon:yes gene_type:complete
MKNYFLKPGIVIQGPLISKGRVPRTEHIKIPDLKETDVVEFNCVDQILEICKIYSNDLPIVISTWNTEDEDLIKRLQKINHKNVKLLLLEDKTPQVQAVGTTVSGNHKYRQIYSTFKGAQELLKFDCTHIIKIRTDMKVDIQLLWNDYLNISSKRPLTLLVPLFSLETPGSIQDNYYISKAQDLVKFFNELLTKKHWFSSIHNEYFYRWLSKEKVILKIIVKIFGDTTFLAKLYVYAWTSFFAPASHEVFKSIVWRGERYPENYKSKKVFYDFFKEGNNLDKSSFNLQTFSYKVFKKFFKFKVN